MDITFITSKLDRSGGGSNKSLQLLARLLDSRGHNISIIALGIDGENRIPAATPYKITAVDLQYTTRLDGFWKIYEIICKEAKKSDVIHIFDPALVPVGGAYRQRHDTCAIVGRLNTYNLFCSNNDVMDGECHLECTVKKKYDHDDNSTKDRILTIPSFLFDTYGMPPLVNAVDELFAISPTVKSAYVANGVDTELISIIPNCYDPTFIRTESAEAPIDEEKNTILYVGRLEEKKGVSVLLDSISQIGKNERGNNQLAVHIVGDGPTRPKLERQAKLNKIEDRIHFHGWVPYRRLPAYYAATNVFVHPCRWPEPFGRTILEAFQHDCVPIVSDVGAPPEIIENVTGRWAQLTFERNNSKDLLRTLYPLIQSAEARSIITEDANLQMYHPEMVIEDLEQRYRANSGTVSSGKK